MCEKIYNAISSTDFIPFTKLQSNKTGSVKVTVQGQMFPNMGKKYLTGNISMFFDTQTSYLVPRYNKVICQGKSSQKGEKR